MPLLFHLNVWNKGNPKNEWNHCVSSVLTGPKMHNQTPRDSSTKYVTRQGTINSKVEHWDYTTVLLDGGIDLPKSFSPHFLSSPAPVGCIYCLELGQIRLQVCQVGCYKQWPCLKESNISSKIPWVISMSLSMIRWWAIKKSPLNSLCTAMRPAMVLVEGMRGDCFRDAVCSSSSSCN